MKTEGTSVLTGVARASYVHLFDKEELSGKYCVTLLIKKSDTKTVGDIKRAIGAVEAAYKSEGGKKRLGNSLHDGDGVSPKGNDYGPECKGCYVLKVSSTTQPRVFDRSGTEILDPEEVYSGCYVRAIINAFAYDKNGSSGISFSLNGMQKWRDGERLSGVTVSGSDFADGFVDDEDGDDDLL